MAGSARAGGPAGSGQRAAGSGQRGELSSAPGSGVSSGAPGRLDSEETEAVVPGDGRLFVLRQLAGDDRAALGPGEPGTPAGGDRPRLILGVTGPRRGSTLAARFADEFNCGLAEGTAERVANFRRICEETGRDPATVQVSTALPVSCGATTARAQRRADALGEAGARLLRLGVIGTPAEVLGRVEELKAAGADTLYFHVCDTDPDHIRLLGGEVLPQVS